MKQVLRLSRPMKDSLSSATYLFAIIGTVASIAGISIGGFLPDLPTWLLTILTLVVYLSLAAVIRLSLFLRTKTGVQLKVNGNTVDIRAGDLFSCDGWKVIPFNEYYDTKVDNITISKTSLNGLFIENHVDNLEDLSFAIANDTQTSMSPPRRSEAERFQYELGTLKRYKGEYLLLAFSHFNSLNEAHLTMAEYEQCLINLWREVNRVYSGIAVYVPLLGSGITRFDDSGWSPNKQDLLKCMICTLRASKAAFSAPITIILTEKAMEEINLYDLRGWF